MFRFEFVASHEPETLPPSLAVSKWEPLEQTHDLEVVCVCENEQVITVLQVNYPNISSVHNLAIQVG